MDITFKTRSGKSDFACSDGELENIAGCEVITADSESASEEETFDNFGYVKDYQPSMPPQPAAAFALVRTSMPGWNSSPDLMPSKSVSLDGTSLSELEKSGRQLLQEFNSDAESSGLFTRPVLIISVWRLKTGGMISPSLPVMIIPNSSRPAVGISRNSSSEEAEFGITSAIGKLYWKISLPESLRDWIGRIESLEIMVSRPLQLYDLSQQMVYGKRLASESFTLSYDPTSGKSSESRVCTEVIAEGWLPAAPSPTMKDATPFALDEFFTIASFPLEDLRNVNEFKVLEMNRGSLAECYSGEPYRPSYAMASLKKGEGAISFKGRTLVWNPLLEYPSFAPLERCMANYDAGLHPRWIFHPDPEAREFQYYDSKGVRHKLPLRRHPGLHGSCYWRGFSVIEADDELALKATDGVREVSLSEHLWISDKNDPVVFEDSKLQNPESGTIKAVCRAFRSSGLVATTVPTIYIFSDEGVFLYKEDSAGSFIDCGLIARYGLESPESLRISATGISFTDSSGITVRISGTTVKKVVSAGETTSSGSVFLVASGEPLRVRTRPLKMGDAGEFKKARRVFLRGNFNAEELTVNVYGSRDMRHWALLGRRKSGTAVFLNRISCRFYKIEIEGVPAAGSTLEGISVIF